MSINIGQRIRQIRTQKCMTQADLADGYCSAAYLSYVENGTRSPSEDFLNHVCKRLNISVEYLFERDIRARESEIEAVVSGYWNHRILTERQRDFLVVQMCGHYRSVILVKIYGVLLLDYVEREFIEEAQQLYDQAQRILPDDLKHVEDPFACMIYYHACGRFFYAKQDFIQANVYLTKAECCLELEDHSHVAVRLLYDISLVKQNIHQDMTIALRYAYRVHDIFIHTRDIGFDQKEKRDFINILLVLATQHELARDYDRAKHFYEKAHRYVEQLDEPCMWKLVCYHLGLFYKATKDITLAKEYLQKSLTMDPHLALDDKKRAYILKELLIIAIEEKTWDKVDEYLSEIWPIVSRHQEALNDIYIEVCALKAKKYFYVGDELTYEKEMRKVIDYATNRKQYKLVCQFAEELGEHFHKVRSYRKASDYLLLACECRSVNTIKI